MESAARVFKLAELRGKTDRQLVELIDNQLDVALRLANETRKRASHTDSAKSQSVELEEICAAAIRWLTVVEDPDDRRRLEKKYQRIRQGLSRPAESRRTWAGACC